MTTPRAPFLGTILTNVERTLTAGLRQHLAKRDTLPETWYALQVIALRGPRLARETLTAELELSRNVDSTSVGELLARLQDEGLIRGVADIELTEKGVVLHRSLRDYIAGPTARLLGQLPADDVATTLRTLQALTDLAAEELMAAG